MSTLTAALLSIGLSGLGQLLLRRGAMEVAPISDLTVTQAQTWFSLLFNGLIAAGLGAWAASTLLWIVVLNRAPLSYVYVLGSLNYLVVPLLSRWLFGEQVSRLQTVGMVVIVAGVLLTLLGRVDGASG
jgi:drug/metabolite transporter (DMT)-like permease